MVKRPVVRTTLRMEDTRQEQITRAVRATVCEYPEVILAYLFGSFLTRDDYHDLDLALLLERGMDPYSEEKLAQKIAFDCEIRTGHISPVDIRVLNTEPVWFAFEVIRTGRKIFEKSPDLFIPYEVSVVTEYLDMKYQYEMFDRESLARGRT